jgi:hypothetical protein
MLFIIGQMLTFCLYSIFTLVTFANWMFGLHRLMSFIQVMLVLCWCLAWHFSVLYIFIFCSAHKFAFRISFHHKDKPLLRYWRYVFLTAWLYLVSFDLVK